jgi:hypothetical protein
MVCHTGVLLAIRAVIKVVNRVERRVDLKHRLLSKPFLSCIIHNKPPPVAKSKLVFARGSEWMLIAVFTQDRKVPEC